MPPAASPGETPSETPAPAAPANPELALIDAAGLDFAERRIVEVYRRVAPSVVGVVTEVLTRSLFSGVTPQEGAGSGFVIERLPRGGGLVLTNYHVIEGARRVEVDFGAGGAYPARVVGVDPRNDLALLEVDAPTELLVPVELGSSRDLQVGQRAVAIGNPFGEFQRTLTSGVISALDRRLEGPEGYDISGVIQTDAAINRGNSGGPLLNSAGQVIGIATAIFSPSGTSAGVGLAVPVDTIKRVLPDLVELGRYRHPWLGVRYAYELTPQRARLLGVPAERGLLLVQLDEGSPLARAGVRGASRQLVRGNQRLYLGGDVLLALDEQPLSSFEELRERLETRHRVGERVSATLLRDGRELRVEVTLAEEPRALR